jgi:hypothetical protein
VLDAVVTWIKSLTVDVGMTEGYVRCVVFGMNPKPEMIFYVNQSGDDGDLSEQATHVTARRYKEKEKQRCCPLLSTPMKHTLSKLQ